jgi:hypothetical protein
MSWRDLIVGTVLSCAILAAICSLPFVRELYDEDDQDVD